MSAPTDRSRGVRDVILAQMRHHHDVTGRWPRNAEIARALTICGATVSYHVQRLARDGIVTRRAGTSEPYRIVGAVEMRCENCGHAILSKACSV